MPTWTRVDEEVLFREALLLRRGPLGHQLLLLSFVLGGAGGWLALHGAPWGAALAGLCLVAIGVTWFGRAETVVTRDAVWRTLRPVRRPRRIAMTDVSAVDWTIGDFQTTMFGGWEGSRAGLMGAVVESQEGPRQVGNRAIRLQLRSGRVVQFATWKPTAALAAIRSALESTPSSDTE